ncbi:hypothetical protein BDV26DRAFT_284045 [Aspergillus bertholletiae]|uniref:Zn(2)-C6 fungal-type domain-containing protein n=1 Tax=Aspergillus bertholletiae TaxID=1226010 RepID=A0A5N7AXY5_9EURO|nr:hypothetical protein BDV26DRAFT_284045 [Aspergillus bertholletiae]
MYLLPEPAVARLLRELSQEQCYTLLDALSESLVKVSSEATTPESGRLIHQPLRTSIMTKDQNMSLFMPVSDTTNTGIKIVTLSQAHGLTAVINLFSPEGRLLGLLSATEVTAFRTALAVMALFVRCKSLKKENIVIVGSGRQAEWHARLALLLVPEQVRSITLINRGRKRLEEMKDMIAELQSAHPSVTFTTLAKEGTADYQGQLQATLAASDVIFSCTPSTEPNFPYSYLQPFKQRFISLIGSYKPHMKEIDTETLFSGGNQIYVDSKEACLEESGELIDAHVKEDQLIEIGEVFGKLGKSEPITVPDTHNVVFKCVGMGLMDLIIGKTLLDIAGLGQQKRPRVSEENRKRAVRACDGCRRVKEKCEGGVPCRRCLRYRRQCVFTHPDHAEKVARSSSISLLERNAGLSRQNLVDSERIRYMERILQHYVPNISFDIQSLRKTAEELKHRHRHSFTDASPSVRLDEEDFEDLAIDDEDYMVKALPDNTTQYSGEFSYLNLSMKIRQKIDEWMKTAAPEASTETDPFEERWRATQLQSGSSLVSASVTCLPPRFVADFLVQIFFKYAQTNNFYVEEEWIREKLNICYTNPSSLTCNDAGTVCSILMVLAVGTQFAHMESAVPVNRPPVDLSSMEDHHFSEDEVGLTFYQFASKLVPDILATVSIRSVQACLLIGTYLLPLDTSGLCYTYFGLALKMAIQNGMHRRYQGEGLSPRMIEVRNRVFWTAYTIEKRVSILHGRPVSLSDSDVDAAMPVDFPGLNPIGQISNNTNMVTLITLTLKLGEVANEISALRKSRRGQQQDCLERLLNLRKDLVDWWSTLPEETHCRDLNPSGPLFRSNVHLKLDYCLTRIFLGRPFLFSNMKILNPTTPQAPPFKTPSGVSKNRSTLITDCVEAALEIINLCQLLRDESGLARASFTEFSSCRAALLVILAQSLTKRTERLREALEKGMVLIKIMSMGVGSARSAVSVIETLERAISRLEDWSERQAPENAGSMESAYDRFKNWEMLWKTGPMSPELVSFQEQYPAGRSSIPPVPVTPMTGTSGANDPMESDVAHTEITTLSDYSASHAASLPPMPRFGFDHFVSNFPQELDEFTAIPCFEPDAQQNLSSDINNPDTKWMQFTTD